MRLIVVSRWAGGPLSDWYPWLHSELENSFDEILIPRMPRPERAEIEAWVSLLDELSGHSLADTLFAGHSVGNQAVLRMLARRPLGDRALGLLAVAAWWHIDEPWLTLLPWLVHDWDVERARNNLLQCRVLISDADPFTRNSAKNAKEWEDRMGAEVTIVPGAKHFNDKTAPQVRDVLLEMASVNRIPR